MNFNVINLGCKVNAYEAESTARSLEQHGYTRVDNDGADINFAPITFTQDDLKGESSKEFTFEIRETGTPSKGITFEEKIEK